MTSPVAPVAPATPVVPVVPVAPVATGDPGRSLARGVAVGTAAQVVAKVLHLVLNVVSTLAIVRHLTPGDYGVYALVLTVTTLVALVADFGLPKLAVREVCSDPSREGVVLGSSVAVRLVLAVGAVGLTQVVLTVFGASGTAHVAAAIAALVGVGEAVLAAVVVVFQVRMVQQYEAYVRTGTELLETVAVVALVALGAPLPALFVPPVVGTALGAAVVVALARHRFGVRQAWDRATARDLLVQALPIAPALVLSVVYRKVDGFAVALFRPGDELGLYSAAAQPVEYAFLTTALLMNVLFPLLAAARTRGDAARFVVVYRRGAESLVVVTLVAPLVLVFVARPLAVDVFGPAYAGADVPFVMLAAAMVLLTVNVWQSLALLTGGHQAVTLGYNAAAVVVAVVLAGVLVPRWGLVGAGWTAIGTASAVLAASTFCMRRWMSVSLQPAPFVRVLAAAGFAAVVLAVAAWASLPWVATAAVGVVAYGVGVRLSGAHRSLRGVVA